MTTSTTNPPAAVTNVDLPFPKRSGKVRDVFDLGDDTLLVVATDRISAFDVVFPNGVPGKGACLTRMTVAWDAMLRQRAPLLHTHLITDDVAQFPATLAPYAAVLEGRAMLVRKLQIVPLECVMRGYLFGSAYDEYQRTGAVCGVELPPGLRLADRLPRPIFTPATKAQVGHDENISVAMAVERGLVTQPVIRQLELMSLALYMEGAKYARNCGILLLDTKFEFGHDRDGTVVLADEVLTPDSSRFCNLDNWRPGTAPPSLDKQYVRDYVTGIGWNKLPPAPPLPPLVVTETSRRYEEISQVLFP